MLVLGVLFAVSWGMVKMILIESNHADIAARCELIADVVSRAASAGEAAVLARLAADAPMRARYTVDCTRDAEMGTRWAWILVGVTLAAGALVAVGTRWHVRRGLNPLRELATRTRAISARRLDQRLSLTDPAEELLPWIEQFNALMQRLEGACAQLEGFNADVAHELRTPLATLIGQTDSPARVSGKCGVAAWLDSAGGGGNIAGASGRSQR